MAALWACILKQAQVTPQKLDVFGTILETTRNKRRGHQRESNTNLSIPGFFCLFSTLPLQLPNFDFLFLGFSIILVKPLQHVEVLLDPLRSSAFVS